MLYNANQYRLTTGFSKITNCLNWRVDGLYNLFNVEYSELKSFQLMHCICDLFCMCVVCVCSGDNFIVEQTLCVQTQLQLWCKIYACDCDSVFETPNEKNRWDMIMLCANCKLHIHQRLQTKGWFLSSVLILISRMLMD